MSVTLNWRGRVWSSIGSLVRWDNESFTVWECSVCGCAVSNRATHVQKCEARA